MCHTIEDPTFDATAYATNPRARIRPIHRPPRVPADRDPHCHWTIDIDPANDPVGPARLTQQIAALPLASMPIAPRPAGRRIPGCVRPRLPADASAPTPRSWPLAREFAVQTHLLMCSAEIALGGTLRRRPGARSARRRLARNGVGRRASDSRDVLGPDTDVPSILALHPAIPPGFARTSRPTAIACNAR